MEKVNKKYTNKKIVSLVFHAGMKVASIAEKIHKWVM